MTMARWKKITAPTRPPDASTVTFQWSTKSYPLKEISSKFKLPLIAQCDAVDCTILWSDFKFDLKQPLLLHEKRQNKKIVARSLKPSTSGNLEEYGPVIAIPEDYDGWFQIIDNHNAANLCRRKLEDIVNREHRYYLTTQTCSGYQVLNKDDGTGPYLQAVTVQSGDIIHVGELTDMSDWKTSSGLEMHSKFIKCYDEKEDEFLVDINQSVSFYPVYLEHSSDELRQRAPLINNVLYSIRTLMKQILPLNIRQIHGEPPNLDCHSSGIFRFCSTRNDETILVSTISEKPLPLELSCNSPIQFQMALNYNDLRQLDECEEALEACSKHGEKYSRKMKVSFTIQPEINYPRDLDNSFYSDSELEETDIGETDANSEFDIEWTPEVVSQLLRRHSSRDKFKEHCKMLSLSNLSIAENPDDNDEGCFV